MSLPITICIIILTVLAVIVARPLFPGSRGFGVVKISDPDTKVVYLIFTSDDGMYVMPRYTADGKVFVDKKCRS